MVRLRLAFELDCDIAEPGCDFIFKSCGAHRAAACDRGCATLLVLAGIALIVPTPLDPAPKKCKIEILPHQELGSWCPYRLKRMTIARG